MSAQDKAFEFPWERAAMRGDEMPDGLALPDQMAYTALRNIYSAYNSKALSREAARLEKRRLVRQYENVKESWAFWEKLSRHHTKILKESEAAKNACRKNPTPENALLLCDVMDGLRFMENMT